MLGASFDSPRDNAAFARKERFPFLLLSDESRALALAFGAASSAKARYARRVSILIDEKGRVEKIYRKVNPRTHASEVLQDLAR